VIRKQNLRLLKEIAIREDIGVIVDDFLNVFRPSKKEFRDYLRNVSSHKKNV